MSNRTSKEIYLSISNSFKELCSDAYSDEWQRITEKHGVVISKKTIKGSPLVAMKGTGVIQAPPEEVFKVTSDIQKVMQWDRVIADAKVIKKVDEFSSILYLAFQGKFPVAPRDFSLVLSYKVENDGTFIQVIRSISDDSVPQISGFVRAKMLPSGFIIKPYRIPGSKQLWSLVTLVIQFDPKGWLPSAMVNKLIEYNGLSIARIRSFITNKREADTPEMVFYKRTTIDELKDDDSTLSMESDEVKIRSPSGSPNRSGSPQHSDDEEESFVDAESDFTTLGVKNKNEFNECLLVVQRELSYMQELLHQNQKKMRILEQTLQATEQKSYVSSLENKTEFEIRANELKKHYAEKLLQVQEQTKQYDILLRTQEDMLLNKVKTVSTRVARAENTINRISFPFTTWTGRILLIGFLLFWPTASSKLLQFLTLWYQNFNRDQARSAFLRWFSSLFDSVKRLISQTEMRASRLIRR